MSPPSLTQILAVALGAAFGALLRWRVSYWFNSSGAVFPLGTVLVNCVGGLLIGMALVYFERQPNETLRLLLVTGFLGGLTTFSAFSAESLNLMQRGDWAWAMAHTLAHVLGALGCAALGFRLAKLIWA